MTRKALDTKVVATYLRGNCGGLVRDTVEERNEVGDDELYFKFVAAWASQRVNVDGFARIALARSRTSCVAGGRGVRRRGVRLLRRIGVGSEPS